MTIEDIKLIINTLDKIQVNGKSNLSSMLGVIQFLEQKMQTMSSIPEQEQ